MSEAKPLATSPVSAEDVVSTGYEDTASEHVIKMEELDLQPDYVNCYTDSYVEMTTIKDEQMDNSDPLLDSSNDISNLASLDVYTNIETRKKKISQDNNDLQLRSEESGCKVGAGARGGRGRRGTGLRPRAGRSAAAEEPVAATHDFARLRSISSDARSRSVTPTGNRAANPARHSVARRALMLGLVTDAEPREIEVPSPPRPKAWALGVQQTPGGSMNVTSQKVPITTTPGGHVKRDDVPLCSNVLERVEAMDCTHEEAEEVMFSTPWHVERWMHNLPSFISGSKPAPTDPSTASAENLGSIRAECALANTAEGSAVVVATTDVDAVPSTSGVTRTSVPVIRTQNEGSDLDSEFDDEFDVEMVAAGLERDIPEDEVLDEPLRNLIQDIERGMDDAIDSLPGLSASFEWVEGFDSFRGVPEEFSGPNPGPVKDYDSPLDAFTDIFDKDLFELIVRETNRYARQTIDDLKDKGELNRSSRVHRWTDTNVEEMMVFFGVLMFMGIDCRSSQAEYWKSSGPLEMPNFRALISFNRYILLNKFLHFVDNSDVRQNRPQNTGMFSGDKAMHMRVWKLSPLLTQLNEKFSSLYNLKRSVSIDESLLLFKGRLTWAQTIRSKAARFGIKSYELCESVTGYMARFQIYTGKSSSGADADSALGVDLGGKSTKVVLELLQGLERRGHCVTMDNFYNCPSLARYLKCQGFDCLGTLRTNRRHVPNEIAKIPKNVRKGTIVARHSGDVSIVAWKDSKVVAVISTYHDDGTCVVTKAGASIVKPKCVDEYNRTMGGVDLKDQKLSMYLLERKRCVKWYIKVFKRLLNVSIHNAFVMYVESLRRRNKLTVTHREFRYALAESLVRQLSSRPTQISHDVRDIMRLRRDIVHEPKYESGSKNRKRCVVCSQESQRKMVNSQCVTCGVFVCFEGCWEIWHSSDTVKPQGRGRKKDA